jgi:hypothetical protein
MAHLKMTLEVIIQNDDAEILEQALNNAIDEIEGQLTVYASSITTSPTGEPENAAEIASRC